jgi:hypothetical protein
MNREIFPPSNQQGEQIDVRPNRPQRSERFAKVWDTSILGAATQVGGNPQVGWMVNLWKLAANQGHAVAQNNYGICLQNETGVPIDFQGAAHYFKFAAHQGHAAAQNKYGLCLHNGTGVPIDFQAPFNI